VAKDLNLREKIEIFGHKLLMSVCSMVVLSLSRGNCTTRSMQSVHCTERC